MWSGLVWNVTVVEMVEIWRESACNLTTSIHNQCEKEKPSLVENKRERGGGGCCNRDKNMKLQRGERERERERERDGERLTPKT